MAKRLKVMPSVKAAYRQSWRERREILRVSWLVVLLSFVLLTLPMFLPALRVSCQIADQILLSVVVVCLLRKYLLDEKPRLEKIGSLAFYLRLGRREVLYAAYALTLLLITYLTDKAAEIVNIVPFIGPLVGSQVWPLVNFTLGCMLILVGPYLAAAPKPAAGELPGVVEAVVGNIGHIMSAVFLISAPYIVMTIILPANRIIEYAEHAVFLICSIVEIKFIGTVYKNLYPAV